MSSHQAPLDTDLYDRVKKALTPQRPRVLVVGGLSKMYDQAVLNCEDLFLFRFIEHGRALRNLSIPKTAGCIVVARASGHRNVEQVKHVRPDDVTLIKGVYDTNVINRVLLRILEERPVVQPEPEITTIPEPEKIPKEVTPVPEETPPKPEADLNATILLAVYSEMPERTVGVAIISDKKLSIAIRGISGADADTRGITVMFLRKGWLSPVTQPGAARVGSYRATEAGVKFLMSHGEAIPDLWLWCPATPPSPPTEETRANSQPSSELATKIAQFEQEIEVEAGLDGELKIAEDKVENLKARIRDRDERKERLKRIKALLEN